MSPQRDTFGAFNFEVEIAGTEISDFLVADLPRISAQPISVREGTDRKANARRVAGVVEIGDLVLVRAYDGNPALWQWFDSITQGQDDRRAVAVVLLNRRHEPIGRWLFTDAWPASYKGPRLDAAASEIATETLTIVSERVVFER